MKKGLRGITCQDLIENAIDLITVFDKNGIIQFESDSVHTILGYRPKELIGKNILDYIHPDEREKVSEAMVESVNRQGKIISGEFAVRHRDGSWKVLEVAGKAFKNAVDEYYIITNSRDASERKNTETILQNIAHGVSSETGDAYFRQLVKYLAETLHADIAFVGELTEDAEETVRTIAVCQGGVLVDNFKYHLKGTPCQNIVGKMTCSYPQNIQQSFPEDKLLGELGVEAYVGVPLFDSKKNALGLLTVLFRNPLNNHKIVEAIIEIFAVRASAELEHRRQDEKLKALLHEKEVLLKEVHHRVKNNLQIISSLLNLQAQYSDGVDSAKIFMESQNRIKTIALVHDELYKSSDLTHIDFAEYVRTLAADIFRAHKESGRISFKMKIDNIYLDVKSAIPCGLIINELIANSLNHAFSEDQNGEISIECVVDNMGRYLLFFKDNGKGFQYDKESMTLGLRLVSILVQQLNGTLEVESGDGARFRVMFERKSQA